MSSSSSSSSSSSGPPEFVTYFSPFDCEPEEEVKLTITGDEGKIDVGSAAWEEIDWSVPNATREPLFSGQDWSTAIGFRPQPTPWPTVFPSGSMYVPGDFGSYDTGPYPINGYPDLFGAGLGPQLDIFVLPNPSIPNGPYFGIGTYNQSL